MTRKMYCTWLPNISFLLAVHSILHVRATLSSCRSSLSVVNDFTNHDEASCCLTQTVAYISFYWPITKGSSLRKHNMTRRLYVERGHTWRTHTIQEYLIRLSQQESRTTYLMWDLTPSLWRKSFLKSKVNIPMRCWFWGHIVNQTKVGSVLVLLSTFIL